ncbi:putative ferulic acid Esterase/Feruloyl esterase [Xylariaceae sp. FL0804]|nr:putative ferulic acid Esterase/Feruloyl esterase [Xylariaceae sp. FL0804]
MNRSWAIPLLSLAGVTTVAAGSCTTDTFTSIVASNPNATVNFAQAVPQNGSFGQGEADLAFPTNVTQLPALCAVGINVKSSANSSYNFGLFLPDKTWNERFITTGNGGLGGGINWNDMGSFSHYGFASMSTDTGHVSVSTDGTWALNAPEAITDWGYRAMHGSVVLSKEIIEAYYAADDGIQYSYYASCSTGGRQGLKEIQMFPEDFDGASLGAPAWWSVHLSSSTLWQGLYNTPVNGSGYIPSDLFPAIVDEMLKQCDPQDGLVDQIIMDPYGCNFDFDALLCTPSSNQSACLTAPQLLTARKFYSDWIDTNQTFVFPGIALGADPALLLGSVSTLGSQFYQDFVYNDTNWDYTQFDYEDVLFADTINPGSATAGDFDMSPFMDRGGKIIHYHGAADNLIPTGSSKYFYAQVQQALEPRGVDLDDFYRLFLVPGMSHCSGSDAAPWYIAGGSQSLTGATTHGVPGYEDADHDVILAMMRWVEQDAAPDRLVATKFVGDDAARGVERQRPLCVYPKQAAYTSGDVDDAASWECKSLY